MKPEYLLSRGFKLVGEDDGYEYIINQYGGYSDHIFYNIKEKRLCVQYNNNFIELYDCTMQKINSAFRLVGLPKLEDFQL